MSPEAEVMTEALYDFAISCQSAELVEGMTHELVFEPMKR